MIAFFLRRWFLISLAVILLAGINGHAYLEFLTQLPGLRAVIVVAVMFLMAFPLRFDALQDSLKRPAAPALGFFLNYGLLPLWAWLWCGVMVAWGWRSDLGDGLLAASAAPCTLASAAVWTRRAGGNAAAAILVTFSTNMLCFVITPLWLTWMLGKSVQLDPLSMMIKLALLVVAPMAAGQLLRLLPNVAPWADRRKPTMSVLAQCGVLMMVLLGAIHAGKTLQAADGIAVGGQLLWMLGLVLVIHLSMLTLGMALARWAGLPREDHIAVGFAGSQKTCMVGLETCAQTGVSILPMVAYHVSQMLIDTVIADRWKTASQNNE